MSDEPQNIYDDPGFFAGYSTLERFGAGWECAAEHADLLALLPDVNGRRVLDLGCGAGQLAYYLATRGAAEVIGVDVSERMLELARTQWAHPRLSYQRISIEEVSFAPARFDLIVSVLALHYVDGYRRLVARPRRGGRVFDGAPDLYRATAGRRLGARRDGTHAMGVERLHARRRARRDVVRARRAKGASHARHLDERSGRRWAHDRAHRRADSERGMARTPPVDARRVAKADVLADEGTQRRYSPCGAVTSSGVA
jgi:SAM-dependent methyltransferase